MNAGNFIFRKVSDLENLAVALDTNSLSHVQKHVTIIYHQVPERVHRGLVVMTVLPSLLRVILDAVARMRNSEKIWF